jgi:hypothetical protein
MALNSQNDGEFRCDFLFARNSEKKEAPEVTKLLALNQAHTLYRARGHAAFTAELPSTQLIAASANSG